MRFWPPEDDDKLNSIVDYVLRIVVLTEKPPCEGGMEEGDGQRLWRSRHCEPQRSNPAFPFRIATGLKPPQ